VCEISLEHLKSKIGEMWIRNGTMWKEKKGKKKQTYQSAEFSMKNLACLNDAGKPRPGLVACLDKVVVQKEEKGPQWGG